MTAARIYIVQAGDAKPVLVKANNQAQALRHVAKSAYTVRAASPLQVAEYMSTGSVLQDATTEPAINDATD